MSRDDSHGHEPSASPSAHHQAHRHEEHEEGVPEWMVSFADNTALMMGFFVILLALNLGPKGASSAAPSPQQETSQAARESGQSVQELDWALGVREAFNNPVDPRSADPRDRILAMRLRERLGHAQDPGSQGRHDRSESLPRGDHMSVVTQLGFAPGQDDLDARDARELDAFLQAVKGHRYMVEVRGHIDSAEVAPGRSAAMQLSFRRALHAAEYLAGHGMDWRQIRIVALGEADPVRSRSYSDQDHAVNRRVEVIETAQVMAN